MSKKGKKWTPEEESSLVEMFKSEVPLVNMAAKLERSASAVIARLVDLHYLAAAPFNSVFYRTDPAPYITKKELKAITLAEKEPEVSAEQPAPRIGPRP